MSTIMWRFSVSKHIKSSSNKYNRNKIASMFKNLVCSDKSRKNQEEECIVHNFPELSCK